MTCHDHHRTATPCHIFHLVSPMTTRVCVRAALTTLFHNIPRWRPIFPWLSRRGTWSCTAAEEAQCALFGEHPPATGFCAPYRNEYPHPFMKAIISSQLSIHYLHSRQNKVGRAQDGGTHTLERFIWVAILFGFMIWCGSTQRLHARFPYHGLQKLKTFKRLSVENCVTHFSNTDFRIDIPPKNLTKCWVFAVPEGVIWVSTTTVMQWSSEFLSKYFCQ